MQGLWDGEGTLTSSKHNVEKQDSGRNLPLCLCVCVGQEIALRFIPQEQNTLLYFGTGSLTGLKLVR